MYKKTAAFLDYMDRSNKFCDRIIAGGNRLNADVINEETNTAILLEVRTKVLKVSDPLSDDVRATELTQPIRMREYDQVTNAFCVLFSSERSTEDRRNAQHVEQICGCM